MDTREQKGIVLAATKKIKRNGDLWIVPSQTDDGTRYTVNPDEQKCTCPDHEVRQVKCKHLFAVELTIRRETDTDGNVTTTKALRLTYSQNWPAYNAAQTEEKRRFIPLLADLCRTIPQPPYKGNGRPPLPLSDMVFACAYKVYSGFSSRRFASDMAQAHTDGMMGCTAHFNRVSSYLSNPDIIPVLQNLVTMSSLPLKSLETDFAVDSSGFGTSRFIRWFNKKYGREIDNREWVKVHLMCGVKTNIVTSVEVSGWAANDTPYFTPLVESTAQQFQIAEVSADKAYLSKSDLHTVETVGGTAYIPFKVNSVAHQGHHKRDGL